MFRILIADPIHEAGTRYLQSQPETQVDIRLKLKPQELKAIVEAYDALVVRSETRVTAEVLEAGKRLQVVGRAGVGVDNIDLDAATRHGIAVVNAPTGNIVAAAEHTIALLLALARGIPSAHASMQAGEWRRSAFMGVEVRRKVLGLLGLGRVGTEVARRAVGLQMRVLAYDPFVAPEYAQRLGVELTPFERVLEESDFLSVHTPLTDTTRGLLGAKEFSRMKRGARIINAARGELIQEEALLQALNDDRLAGAALDVFTHEPPGDSLLVRHPKVVVTPHLGASTVEAQEEVALEVGEQVMAVLKGQPARNTVNAPFLLPEVQAVIAPYLEVARVIGKIAIQLVEGQLSSVTLTYAGEIAGYDNRVLEAAAIMGLLQPVSDERVNLVNASFLATQRGLKVTEQKAPASDQYANLMTLELSATGGGLILAGTHMRGETHIVRIRNSWLDLVPSSPYMLFIDHHDRPGLIGAVGTITGQHNINISFMEVGRLEPRGRAEMVVGLDDPMPEAVLAKILAIGHIYSAKLVRL